MSRWKHRNEYRKPEKRIISFGKYAGHRYSNVPTDYLLWFVKNAYHQMKDRRRWASEELKRRGIDVTT